MKKTWKYKITEKFPDGTVRANLFCGKAQLAEIRADEELYLKMIIQSLNFTSLAMHEVMRMDVP